MGVGLSSHQRHTSLSLAGLSMLVFFRSRLRHSHACYYFLLYQTVETKLIETPVQHLMDIDGDTCHHVKNAAQKVSASFEKIPEKARNRYMRKE